MTKLTFGEKLKAARIQSGLKQTELAKKLNTTGNTISNWENNVSKPDLDMLSYICGILHVTASYFLQAELPEDEVSIPELNMVKKYRDLDDHGREMVDFALIKEWERSTKECKVENTNKKDNIIEMPSHLIVNAAHERTDIEVTDEMRKHDDDIMNDDSEWE